MNPVLAAGGYRVSHRVQYPQGTHRVYSNFTPRNDRFFSSPLTDGKLVFLGLQGFMQQFLVDLFNETFFARPGGEVVSEYKQVMNSYLNKGAMMIPVLTIINTQPEFFWLVGYLETVLSAELWKTSTNVTIAHHYRKICARWAEQTCSDLTHPDFQCHDFSFRDMSGLQDTVQMGSEHLLSFKGAGSIPSLLYARDYYTDGEPYFTGASIPITKHSVVCMDKRKHEIETFRRLIADLYPQGFVSIVSGTWDYWQVLTEYVHGLRDIILTHEGQVVFRPDNDDPVEILCDTGADEDTRGDRTAQEKGSMEMLWEIFGGTIDTKGYKVLDPHVGLIYGGSITPERANEVLRRLEAKGFASSNVVFGAGSFTYQYDIHDTLGFAMKATWGKIDGKGRTIFKEPKTDNSLKRSARGLLHVIHDEQGELRLHDGQTWEQEQEGELRTRFLNGKLFNHEHFEEICQRLATQG